MTRHLQVGDKVRAVSVVSEEGFAGSGAFIHAQPKDPGRVYSASGDTADVWFERTGTLTVCHVSELEDA